MCSGVSGIFFIVLDYLLDSVIPLWSVSNDKGRVINAYFFLISAILLEQRKSVLIDQGSPGLRFG